MLYRIPKNSTTDAPPIRGQFLAKNKLGKRERAQLAVAIVNGRVRVGDLTITQAARLCRVSVPYVNDARKPATAAGETLSQRFARATTAERRAFARAVGVDLIWDELIEPLI